MQSMVFSRESIFSVYAIVIPVRPLFATSPFTQSTGMRYPFWHRHRYSPAPRVRREFYSTALFFVRIVMWESFLLRLRPVYSLLSLFPVLCYGIACILVISISAHYLRYSYILLFSFCHAQTNALLILDAIACIFLEAPLLPFFFYFSSLYAWVAAARALSSLVYLVCD